MKKRKKGPRVISNNKCIKQFCKIDLMNSPINPLLGRHGERTSAIYGTIPIINALFTQYNEKVNLEW